MRFAEWDDSEYSRPVVDRLREEHAEMRSLLMTLMDVAIEASGEKQTYDFKPRAESAARAAHTLLNRGAL